MKKLRKVLLIAILVVVSLWAGYGIGYHRAVRDERRALSSSIRVERDRPDRVFVGPPTGGGSFDALLATRNSLPGKASK